MSRAATDRLKCNPPLGRMPVLQNLLPSELLIDPTYQRTLDTAPSQSLVRKIAMFWNWDLCQPLVVARRDNGELYVIDGQHRLAAARLRGDIAQLPAVVVHYATQADEAASFVHLNQERRPLSKLDVFKAAIASGDTQSCAIADALAAAGLSVARTTNPDRWDPGQLINIGGIERSWRERGPRATALALRAMALGFEGQVLRYAGSIFPGIATIIATELKRSKSPDTIEDERWAMCVEMIAASSQAEWRKAILAALAADDRLNHERASAKVFTDSWDDLLHEFLDEAA